MDWTVDVTFTDRTRLPSGGFREFKTTVNLSAQTSAEAILVACQMVASLREALGCMVTGARIRD